MAKKENNVNGNLYWWILGLVLPPVGLVLYFIWRKNNSKAANNVIKGTIVSACIWLFLVVSLLAKDNNYIERENTLVTLNVTSASKTIQKWYNSIAEGNQVVTIIASSTCPHCQEYKPVIKELSEKEGFELYFFEADQLEDTDYGILTSAFELEEYEGSVPYTFVVNEKKFVNTTTGYADKDTTINFLKSAGVLEN